MKGKQNHASVAAFEAYVAKKAQRQRRQAAKRWLDGIIRRNGRVSKSGAPVDDCSRHVGTLHETLHVKSVHNGRGEVIGLFCVVCGTSVDLADLRDLAASYAASRGVA